MFNVEPWQFWIVLGIIFVIIEIFDPAFYFIALGIGAIFTGLLSLFGFVEASVALQIILFAIISFVAFLFTRKLGKKILAHTGGETNVNALIGREAFVTQVIPADGRGRVKIGGEEWVAVAQDKGEIALGAKVTVLAIDGNKVVVNRL